MSNQPSTLAEGFASLRRAAEAQPHQGWMPSSVHALIMACLMRIFARLEDFIRAWQDGTLTPPPPRAPAAATPHGDPQPDPCPAPAARSWFDLSAWSWSWPWADLEGQGAYAPSAQYRDSVRARPARARNGAPGEAYRPDSAPASQVAAEVAAEFATARALGARPRALPVRRPAMPGPRPGLRARRAPPRISISRHPARAPPAVIHPCA